MKPEDGKAIGLKTLFNLGCFIPNRNACLILFYKIMTSTRIKQLKALKNFIFEHDLPLGIVTNNSNTVEVISERIIQIPITFV